jgi:hypothetical protein
MCDLNTEKGEERGRRRRKIRRRKEEETFAAVDEYDE